LDLSERLVEAGYSRQDPTDTPGEFSIRGGVVDFYPAGARHLGRLPQRFAVPARVEGPEVHAVAGLDLQHRFEVAAEMVVQRALVRLQRMPGHGFTP